MSHLEPPRKGTILRHEGHLYVVADSRVAQSGKQKPTVHVKLRALDGHSFERTLDQLGTFAPVPSEVREMQYLYASGAERVFMDTVTFDQHNIPDSRLGDAVQYLAEEQLYRFLCVDGQPISLQLPAIMVLEVADTAPPEHAGGGSSVFKEARLNTGRVVKVPLFIKKGDKLRVKTDTGEYQGKEH